jgi:hypothetical protein
MDSFINAILNNYEWIFSGIGIFIIGLFLKRRSSSTNRVDQKNIMAGGDVVGRDKR